MRHKFRAIRTERDGIKFASKLEALYYDHLKLLQKAGEVVMFLRQVPFHLPGNVRYVCDYAVFNSDGSVQFIDVKGLETQQFKVKRKLVESIYPVQIKIVKKGDF